MTRAAAIAAAERYFDKGGFVADLARRVAIPTESQVEERLPVLHGYLADEIAPSHRAKSRIMKNIRWRFAIDWTPGWDAADVRSELLVLAFHPRFSAGGETAKTSDAR